MTTMSIASIISSLEQLSVATLLVQDRISLQTVQLLWSQTKAPYDLNVAKVGLLAPHSTQYHDIRQTGMPSQSLCAFQNVDPRLYHTGVPWYDIPCDRATISSGNLESTACGHPAPEFCPQLGSWNLEHTVATPDDRVYSRSVNSRDRRDKPTILTQPNY